MKKNMKEQNTLNRMMSITTQNLYAFFGEQLKGSVQKPNSTFSFFERNNEIILKTEVGFYMNVNTFTTIQCVIQNQ